MAAALGEKDGFPLGPQLFFAFSPPRGSGLGARSPANPYYSVSFAPSFILFSPARGFQLPGRRRSYLYMYTNDLFYFVYMAYFLLHSTNS